MTDPVADMLTRIRNAKMVGKRTVLFPHSNLLWSISELLEQEGYISNLEKRGRKVGKNIEVQIVYSDKGKARINGLRRISRPGKRVYEKSTDLRSVKNGMGFSVVSTSKGMKTGPEARKEGLGGEVMFNIW